MSLHGAIREAGDIVGPADTWLSRLARAADIYDVIVFDGCPCFRVQVPGFEADGDCWRVSDVDDVAHTIPAKEGRCCVHVKGNGALAAKLKQLLDSMDWYGDWSLMVE